MTYRPPYFRDDERATLLALLAEHPLATLVTAHDGDLSLTHVPLLARLDGEHLLLEGHLARANDQWRHQASSAVAVFRIAAHYVSPTWYPSKAGDPRTVPTYDYVAIEARGNIRWIHETDWLEAFVRRLSDDQEARVAGTWSADDAPPEYMASQLKAIVGIEMRVESLAGTFKLNQNHPRENIESVRRHLLQLATPASVTLADFIED